jgi:hypothetical protein
VNKADQDDLAEALAAIEPADEPGHGPPRAKAGSEGWKPRLNPTQEEMFNDPAQNIVSHGGKGSGKTIGHLHSLVRHCYENNNALALIIGTTARVATEGAGHDLVDLVLPAWRDGNRDINGNLLDDGIGLEFTQWKLDPVTKDRHLWIGNRHGGWSKVLLVSIPHAKVVRARIFGIQPSHVYVEELHNCDGIEYYDFPAAQLGRRRGVGGPQQWTASTNPERPAHWTYKLLFEQCVVATGGRVWNKDTENPGIRRDSNWSVYHVPFEENKANLPPGYYERLQGIFRKTPTLYARMVEGKWVDFPSGVAIFKNNYAEQRHVIGNAKNKAGIVPLLDHPVVVGYDTGQVHTGVSFMQCIETRHGPMWSVIDEMCYFGERIPYRRFTRGLLMKMAYWNRRMNYNFDFLHITDDEAITTFKPNSGSTTARDIQDYSKEYIALNDTFKDLRPIRMVGCPKPPGSKEARVDLTMDLLDNDMLVISAPCSWHRRMFLELVADRASPMVPARGRYIHTFDSMSYPIYFRRYQATKGFGRLTKKPEVRVSV